ncbi:MAG: tetratricopeptide repeat protein, partial [Pseudomonadales bacterium]
MTQLTRQQVLALLRTGTPGERAEFVKDLPPNGFKDAALSLIGSDNPVAVVLALVPLIGKYSFGSNPECGALLASATHERALEIWETVPNHGLVLTTLSALASHHAKALTLLGRSDEVLEVTKRYIPLYEELGEEENLPSLKVLQIEALVNLKKLDEADKKLQDDDLLKHPIAGIEARRLKGLVDRLRADPTNLPSSVDPAPSVPSSQNLLDMMKTAIGRGFEGELGKELKKHVDQLDPDNRLDPKDPAQYQQLLDTLGQAEAFFTKGGTDSELTVRGKIRNASAIFVHGTPPPEVIEASLRELESSLAWAKDNAITELENDALWGIYLCNSRLQRPSEAADALIELRGSLETMRRGIKEPLTRGGIFSTYRYLFNAMCEQLQKAGRADDLLEAIESSKGRVIADKLTEQIGDVVEDSAIYGCVARLPQLVSNEQFHYLTYFVDEECVYAVLVSKQGTIHAIDPVKIANHELRDAVKDVDPGQWGQPQPWAPGTVFEDVSARLGPLVAWLDGLVEQGIVEKGDHICYSSDDSFHNVPLQYLSFKDGIVIDWF